MVRAIVMMALLVGCDDGAAPDVPQDCTRAICARLVACSPIVVGPRDWRTRASCERTQRCGRDPDVCREAVAALTCIGPGATPGLTEAHAGGVWAVVRACNAHGPLPPGGGRLGPGAAPTFKGR